MLPEVASMPAYWAHPSVTVLASVKSDAGGLSTQEAAERLRRYGPNLLRARPVATRLRMIARQLRNPLLGLLVLRRRARPASGSTPTSSSSSS